jgi:transposase
VGGIEGKCRVALEATYGRQWLADVLQDAGYELHLAHPMRTKAIASARAKDRRRRRAHTGAPVARRPVAGGLHRAARAA